MSRFQKLSHVLWYCQYHIVFVPKYRYRVLKGDIGKFVYKSIYAHTERSGCEVVELNVQPDHVHLLVKVGYSHKPGQFRKALVPTLRVGMFGRTLRVR